jgi:hypothetical protein
MLWKFRELVSVRSTVTLACGRQSKQENPPQPAVVCAMDPGPRPSKEREWLGLHFETGSRGGCPPRVTSNGSSHQEVLDTVRR